MKFTLDKKVSLYIVSILFTFAAILGIYFLRNQERVLSDELDERVSVLLNNLSRNLEYPVLVRDREAIARLVAGVMAQKEIVSCRVAGRGGVELHRLGGEAGGAVRAFTAEIVTRTGAGGEDLILNPRGAREERIGQVRLHASLSGLNSKIDEVERTILGVLAAAILLSALGAVGLLRRLIGTPIAALVEATQRVSRGEFAHKIPVTNRDELGALAAAFNAMTDSLVEAQEELLRREKLVTLGQLAGSVGNELRNPLGVMNNAVFYLRNLLTDGDETVKEYLEILQGEIDTSRHILSDFIDFFRTRSPRTELVAVTELIGENMDKLAVPANIALRLELSDSLPPLKVDPVQMGQVLQNLVANAIQAMPAGGALNISARLAGAGLAPARDPKGQSQGLPPGDFVEISVIDTGEGISPENMEKLFQPLFSTRSRGVGLGLPISRNLVEANGGRIDVESAQGKGSCFAVLLPAGA